MYTVINCYLKLPNPNPIFACVRHGIIGLSTAFYEFQMYLLKKKSGISNHSMDFYYIVACSANGHVTIRYRHVYVVVIL